MMCLFPEYAPIGNIGFLAEMEVAPEDAVLAMLLVQEETGVKEDECLLLKLVATSILGLIAFLISVEARGQMVLAALLPIQPVEVVAAGVDIVSLFMAVLTQT